MLGATNATLRSLTAGKAVKHVPHRLARPGKPESDRVSEWCSQPGSRREDQGVEREDRPVGAADLALFGGHGLDGCDTNSAPNSVAISGSE